MNDNYITNPNHLACGKLQIVRDLLRRLVVKKAKKEISRCVNTTQEVRNQGRDQDLLATEGID